MGIIGAIVLLVLFDLLWNFRFKEVRKALLRDVRRAFVSKVSK